MPSCLRGGTGRDEAPSRCRKRETLPITATREGPESMDVGPESMDVGPECMHVGPECMHVGPKRMPRVSTYGTSPEPLTVTLTWHVC